MERFVADERTGLKYELVGDYYLIAGDDEPETPSPWIIAIIALNNSDGMPGMVNMTMYAQFLFFSYTAFAPLRSSLETLTLRTSFSSSLVLMSLKV